MSDYLDLTGICNTKRDVEIYFKGIRLGIFLMRDFALKKNVNTGKPLTIEEMINDYKTLEDSAKLLFDKGE